MAEASNLKSFETAADGDTDEPQKPEIEISPAPENNRLNNLMSGNLDLTRSVILFFPFDIGFVSSSPFIVDLDEDGADEAFE